MVSLGSSFCRDFKPLQWGQIPRSWQGSNLHLPHSCGKCVNNRTSTQRTNEPN